MTLRLFLTGMSMGALMTSLCSACGGNTCPEGQTRLDLSIGVSDPATRPLIQSLWVELTIGDQRGRKLFNPGMALQQGRFAVAVEIDTPAASSSQASITVSANDESNGTGAVVAEGTTQMTIVERTCNSGSVDLQAKSASDEGGPPGSGSNPSMPARACPTVADSGTIALYDFEDLGGALINQRSPALNGRLVGSGFTSVPGPTGCGSGLQFPASHSSDSNDSGDSSFAAYGLIPDRSLPGSHGRNAFSLSEGSFDLWIRRPPATTYPSRLTVAARDLASLSTGVALMIACDGTLVARIGRVGGQQFHQCSDAPTTPDTWHHAVVNFGPPGFELVLDDVRQTRTGSVGLAETGCTGLVACGTSTTTGIDVGTSPWVVGVDAAGANPATIAPVEQPFPHGGIDELRISNVRR
jgi:hypothetical protein